MVIPVTLPKLREFVATKVPPANVILRIATRAAVTVVAVIVRAVLVVDVKMTPADAPPLAVRVPTVMSAAKLCCAEGPSVSVPLIVPAVAIENTFVKFVVTVGTVTLL